MKRILLLFSLLVVSTTGLYAQVGIGTTDPTDSAQLEVLASEKGVLIPRLALSKTSVFLPVKGTEINSLLVYNTATNTATAGEEVYPGYYYWYEGKWNRVISQNDFSNTNITKTILNGSNIVTYNSKSNTFNYYTASGTGTATVDVISIINSSTTTETIRVEKIQPGTSTGTVLTTIFDGTKTITKWVPQGTPASGDLNLGKGLLSVVGTATSTSVKDAVLKTLTVTVKDLPVELLEAGDSNKGKILAVDASSGVATWTSELPASVTVSVTNVVSTISSTSSQTQVVTIDKNGVATVTTIEKLISNTISATNGLTMSGTVIELGGKITKSLTLAVDTTKSVAVTIDGLTNTGTVSSTVDKVMVLGKDNVLHTVSATAFKGSGDYKVKTTGVAEPVETGNVMIIDNGNPIKEMMVTIPIVVNKGANKITKDNVVSMAGFGSYTRISDIRIFSKATIGITDSGVIKQRRVSYSAATLEGSGVDTVIIPTVGGISTFYVYPGEYYVVIKYFE